MDFILNVVCSMRIYSSISPTFKLKASLSSAEMYVMSSCIKKFEMNYTHGSSVSNLRKLSSNPSPCSRPQMQEHGSLSLTVQRKVQEYLTLVLDYILYYTELTASVKELGKRCIAWPWNDLCSMDHAVVKTHHLSTYFSAEG